MLSLRLSTWLRRFAVLALPLVSVLASPVAQAAIQRGFVNLGFEEPQISTGSPCRASIGDHLIPGWITDHPLDEQNVSCPPGYSGPSYSGDARLVEVWRGPRQLSSGQGDIAARSGIQFAELNAEALSKLTQDICLIQGEQVEWRFSHNGRNSSPDSMIFSVGSQDVVRARTSRTGSGAVQNCYSGTCNPAQSQQMTTSGRTRWADYSGSFIYNAATGDSVVGFESAGGSSTNGNFLDDIQLVLKPVVEFQSQQYRNTEGATAATNMQVVIIGAVPAGGLTLDFQVSPTSTAAIGVDYWIDGGTNTNFSVTVPEGEYEEYIVDIPVTVRDENAQIDDEKWFELNLIENSDDYNLVSSQSCGASGNALSRFTVLDSPVFSGHVFEDDGSGAGSVSGNGLKEGDEAGFNEVTVRILGKDGSGQCDAGAVLAQTQTDADGAWQLQLSGEYVGDDICLLTDPAAWGYESTSESSGNAPSSQVSLGAGSDDRIDFIVPEGGSEWNGLNFGDERLPNVCHPQSMTMQLGADATRDGSTGQITLTPAIGNRRGFAWSENQISLLSNFSLQFDVYLGTRDTSGADGIVFAFQDDAAGNAAVGEFGGALGMGGVSPAVAVEFDTWNNGGTFNDISDDHTMIYNPQGYSQNSSDGQQYSSTYSLGNIEDGQWHSVQLDWDAATKTLSYSFDGNIVTSTNEDFINDVFGGDPNVYFGFTAATGGSYNEQKVCITDAPPQVFSDYGDAPDSFGEPSHHLGGGLRLGADVDAETGGYNDDDAAADNFDDGVVFPGDLPNPASIEVEVSGSGGYLQAWVDWNQDGSFSESERIATDLQDSDNDGVIMVPVTTPPVGTVPGASYARFRWSSQQGLDAEEGALDGEVEDYRVTVGPTTFQCTNTLYQVATSDSLLRRIDFAGSSASFVDVGPGAGKTINAGWGYNDQDGFIHGLKSGSKELWFIDANGHFYDNGTPLGLPSNRKGSNAGDVLPDGRMIYKTANNRLSVIDLTDSPPSYQGDISLSSSSNFIDMAYNPVDGNVYSINGNNDRLFWIDLATGQVTYFGPAVYNGSYGAQWFDEDGRFYAYENGANKLYYIDVGVDGDGSGNSVLLAESSNTAGGINDGAFCRGEAPIPLGALSGKVYQDLDGSDVFDSGEPGLASILVELYRDNGTPSNLGDDVLVGSVDTDSNGAYLFPAVLAGQTYRVDVNSSDPDLPSGAALGTDSPLVGIPVQDGLEASSNDFGFDILDIILSGWVFEDNGEGATAHDGVKGSYEPGLADVTVSLYLDSDNNGVCASGDPLLASGQTSGDGAFSFSLSPTEAGKAVCLVAQTPSGFVSVSENGGSLPATTGSDDDDLQSMMLPAPGTVVTGLLFGDAGRPILEPDQQGVVTAGSSRFYSHRFTALSAGNVNFVLDSASTSPASPVWSDTLYRDDNCNGVLDSTEASLPLTGVSVVAGQQRCLLVKVFAPGNASVGALHTRALSAIQVYTGTAFQASAQVVDTTRIAAGELELEKRVQNLTAGGADGTSNRAEPGDVLRYRLIFRNQGSSALTEVVINDNTPAFTSLNGPVGCPPLPLPVLLSGCVVNTPNGANAGGYRGAIEWTFTGELQPGAEGEIRYEIKVDE